MTTLGHRIRTVRMALGLSQQQLAQHLGAGRPATVSNWERNRAVPDRGTLKLLADLTSNALSIFLWLQFDGPEPEIAPRSATPTPHASAEPLPSLPQLPSLDASPEQVQRAYAEFTQRVAALAIAGKLVPAHHLLEWAAMLLRTHELYALANQRLRVIMRELPLVVFELNAEGQVVGFHLGTRHDLPIDPEALLERPLSDVLPQLPAERLNEAMQQTRAGVMAETVMEIGFQDQRRHYTARLYLLPDGHTMAFIERASDARRDELGIHSRVKKQTA